MEKLAAEMAAAEEAARRRAEEREREAAEQAEKAAQQAQQQQQEAAGNKAAEQSAASAGGAGNPTSGTKDEDKPTPMETGEHWISLLKKQCWSHAPTKTERAPSNSFFFFGLSFFEEETH